MSLDRGIHAACHLVIRRAGRGGLSGSGVRAGRGGLSGSGVRAGRGGLSGSTFSRRSSMAGYSHRRHFSPLRRLPLYGYIKFRRTGRLVRRPHGRLCGNDGDMPLWMGADGRCWWTLADARRPVDAPTPRRRPAAVKSATPTLSARSGNIRDVQEVPASGVRCDHGRRPMPSGGLALLASNLL
jgi:hypothetical protein